MGRRFLILSVLFGFTHLMASFFLFAALFTASMDRFDNGGDSAEWEGASQQALAILTFPAVLVFWYSPSHLPALVQNGLFIINSLLWGCAASWIVRQLYRQDAQLDNRRKPMSKLGKLDE
jgi:hypothetical protein